MKLKFAKGNAKLGVNTAIFSLPAGHTCPGALACLSRADKVTGSIKDGIKTVFRCYAASAENLFRNVRVSRWRNFEMLRKALTRDAMRDLILASMPRKGIKLCRVHSSGDFYSQTYFDAWMAAARAKPDVIFYAYTKALNFWIERLGSIPENFRLVASKGGRFDALIDSHKLRHVRVVFSEAEARKLGLKLDHDDTLAWKSTKDFALLLHGTQPAGSKAGRVLYALRKSGKGGYKADYFKHYEVK